MNQKNKCNFSRDFISKKFSELTLSPLTMIRKIPKESKLEQRVTDERQNVQHAWGESPAYYWNKRVWMKRERRNLPELILTLRWYVKGLKCLAVVVVTFPTGEVETRDLSQRGNEKSKWWVTLPLPVVHVVAGEICFSPWQLWFLRSNFYH